MLLIALGGCAFVDDFDALRAISKPISGKVESTSGSGTIVSPAYELRLNVGHPQPMGVIESPSYRLELGPTAP